MRKYLKKGGAGMSLRYLTVQELAELLKISLTTAYAMVHSGQVRSIRIGAQYRIPAAALEELEKEWA